MRPFRRISRDLHSVTSASRWLESAFIDTAMVNCPTPSNSMAPLPAYPVEEIIEDGEASKLDRAFAAANYSDSENCFDIENQTDPHGFIQWLGLADMVMPISYSNQNMFPPFENDDKGDQKY
ncbi:unnamed protein product [Arabidopsis halleri]